MEGSDVVQPGSEGQGDSDVGSFFDLSNVPEDYQPHLEPILKEVQKNVDGKFREHADYRKQWEPYDELGLTEYDPESVQKLLQFAELIEDQDQFRQWWEAVGSEYGWSDELLGDSDLDGDDDFSDGDDVLDLSTLEQTIAEKLDERLGPFLEQQRTQEEQHQIEEATAFVDSEIARLKEEYGDFDEQAVYRFAAVYDSQDAIERGVKDYLSHINEIKKGVVAAGGNSPRVPEGEGLSNTNQEPITNFKDASAMAKDRLREALGS